MIFIQSNRIFARIVKIINFSAKNCTIKWMINITSPVQHKNLSGDFLNVPLISVIDICAVKIRPYKHCALPLHIGIKFLVVQ